MEAFLFLGGEALFRMLNQVCTDLAAVRQQNAALAAMVAQQQFMQQLPAGRFDLQPPQRPPVGSLVAAAAGVFEPIGQLGAEQQVEQQGSGRVDSTAGLAAAGRAGQTTTRMTVEAWSSDGWLRLPDLGELSAQEVGGWLLLGV
jgi:hypothetical protein